MARLRGALRRRLAEGKRIGDIRKEERMKQRERVARATERIRADRAIRSMETRRSSSAFSLSPRAASVGLEFLGVPRGLQPRAIRPITKKKKKKKKK